MTDTPQIIAFAGSTRKDSYNKKLVKVAAAGARTAGAKVTYVDLRDLPMPLYDADLEAEEGIPANAREFKKLLLAHQGMLIASPEYNSSIAPVLKNALDWASRPEPNEPGLAAYLDKVAGLMSASPGALGGLRGLGIVRSMLSSIRVLVIPDQVAIGKAHEAFDEWGQLKDPSQQELVEQLGNKVATLVSRLY
jgi:chromate reductase, NAD(P)H dehydrogenase (quinone)